MEKNMQIDIKAVGQKIREAREKLALSREEFAEIIGLSDYYVGQLERGERQMSLPVLVKVSNCLHISLDYLIFGKTSDLPYYVYESCNTYDTCKSSNERDIIELLNRCSVKELELVKKLIKTILPYLNNNFKSN